jgi:hypothetical protein
MRPQDIAAVTAASLAALSLVQPTSATSAAFGSATCTQLSESDHPKYDALQVFERGKPAGGVGSNVPKVNVPSGTATAISTSTTLAASTKTQAKAPEATESPDQAEIAAIEFYRLAYEGSRTDCDAKNDLRDACTNLIENAAGDAYPDWRNQTARGLRAYADPNTCFGDLMGLSGKQNSALIWMAGQLEAGEEVPTE